MPKLTETDDGDARERPPSLSPVLERFVLHWGEMGTRWGVNRSVAQVHALLYVSARPLTAEDIAGTLGIARSNVSTSLRELLGWGIVRVVHQLGDRRDHFESLADVWEMFRIIVRERKRREVDPTLAVLRESVAALDGDAAAPESARRLRGLLEFFEAATSWHDQVAALPTAAVRRLVRSAARLKRLFLPREGGAERKGGDGPRD